MKVIVSIHAPVKGATTGVDIVDVGYPYVSIHAPVKGATLIVRTNTELN